MFRGLEKGQKLHRDDIKASEESNFHESQICQSNGRTAYGCSVNILHGRGRFRATGAGIAVRSPMPYRYEPHNRHQFRRAVLSGVALAFVLLLLALAPARMLGWSGLAFGTLTVPEPAIVQEVSVESPAAKALMPPALEPLTFPEYAEWSDLTEASCAECDWSVSYGLGGALDEVDTESLDRLERSSQLTASSLSPGYGSGHSSGSAGFSGGGASGAGAATEASDTGGETPMQADEAGDAEATEATIQTSETPAADAVASRGSSTDGGSSASDGGSSTSEVGSAGDSSPGASSDATETNLVLSPTPQNADGDSGSLSAAAAQVVQALAEAPVGAETVHSLGEPDAIEALSLEEESTSSESGASAELEAASVPEPASLILMGLALSAVLYRLRRVERP